jgi:hypothetical protein
MTFLGSVLLLAVKLAPYKGMIAFAAAVLAALVLAVLAIHLQSATLRVYPVYGLAVLSFFTGFLMPRATLPPL